MVIQLLSTFAIFVGFAFGRFSKPLQILELLFFSYFVTVIVNILFWKNEE